MIKSEYRHPDLGIAEISVSDDGFMVRVDIPQHRVTIRFSTAGNDPSRPGFRMGYAEVFAEYEKAIPAWLRARLAPDCRMGLFGAIWQVVCP